MFWLILLFLIGLTAFWLRRAVAYIQRPTIGDPIEDRPGKALLLVDLQQVFWTTDIYPEDVLNRVEGAVLREVALAQDKNIPVIALRQEWSTPGTRIIARLTMKGRAIKGTSGTELAPPFQGLADHVVIKRVQDGFETGELDTLCRAMRIGHLRIMGLDGSHCIAKTAQAALNRGYDVDLIRDGIAAADPEHFETVKDALTGQGARLV